MSRQQDLQVVLTKYCPNVYFQPPEGHLLKYPCIVYQRADIYSLSANNDVYFSKDEWSLTVIDYDPDSEIPRHLINELQMCRYGQSYVADNLNHTKLKLYF